MKYKYIILCICFLCLVKLSSQAAKALLDVDLECYRLNGLHTNTRRPYFGLPSVGEGEPNEASISNPLTVNPVGVQYCREMFRYFPCSVLRETEGTKKDKCSAKVLQFFLKSERFDCASLLEYDPDALFFFILRDDAYDNGFECVSVCKKEGGFVDFVHGING